MEIVQYIGLSLIDTLAYCAIAYKLFRLPYIEYLKELIVMAFIVSCSSYLLRVQAESPILDMGFQLILYVMFLVFVVRMRLNKSVILTAVGYSAFAAVQIVVALGLFSTGLINSDAAGQATGMGIIIVQVVNQIAVFFISWMFYRLKWGFSFIIRPPHDFYIKEDRSRIERILLGVSALTALAFIISTSIYQHVSFFIVAPITVVAAIALFILSNKRNYHDSRFSRNIRS